MSIQRDAIADAQPSDGSTAGKGAVFIGIAKIYFMLSGFVQQVLLTRLIDLADYGAFAVVNNTISIVNNTVVQAEDGRWALNIQNGTIGSAIYNNILLHPNRSIG